MTKNTYNFYIGKKVYINLKSNIFYNGIVLDVDGNNIVLDERKLGRTLISTDSISTIELRGENYERQ